MVLATCEITSATASSKRCIYTALVTDVELCPSAFEMLNIGTFWLLATLAKLWRGDELRDALAQNVRLIRLSRLVDGDVALGVLGSCFRRLSQSRCSRLSSAASPP